MSVVVVTAAVVVAVWGLTSHSRLFFTHMNACNDQACPMTSKVCGQFKVCVTW